MATKRLPRPRDPIALAKLIGDIATGQVVDSLETVDEAGLAAIKGRSGASRDQRKGHATKPGQIPGKRGS